MSDLREVKDKSQKQLDEIDIDLLNDRAKAVGYLSDRMTPILSEIIATSSSEAKDYEEAYKLIVTKIRKVLEGFASEKRNTEALLFTSIGKKAVLEEMNVDVSSILQKQTEAVQQERVEKIAEKIQSGSFDPDVPRKIGQRPEKIKDIRAAKQTLFGTTPTGKNLEE